MKIIQVGLGHWGSDWAKTVVPNVPGAEMTAYVDAAPAALENLQSELGIDPSLCFATLAEALERVDCDLVLATLRTEAHFPVVREALMAGCNVIVEKPFASTIAEARALVALAEERNRILMVSQNYRYYPAPRLAAELVADAALGALNMVGLDFRYHAPTMGYRYWEMPDPLLADMSIHHFDLMRLVLNDNPKRVTCTTWNPPGSPFLHHPVGLAIIEFERGTLVGYRASWMSGGPRTPWAGEWTMDCAEGEIVWSSRDTRAESGITEHLEVRRRGERASAPVLPEVQHIDRMGALAAAIEAVETGSVPSRFPSGADNINSLALVAASILSAGRQGAWVEIEEALA